MATKDEIYAEYAATAVALPGYQTIVERIEGDILAGAQSGLTDLAHYVVHEGYQMPVFAGSQSYDYEWTGIPETLVTEKFRTDQFKVDLLTGSQWDVIYFKWDADQRDYYRNI